MKNPLHMASSTINESQAIKSIETDSGLEQEKSDISRTFLTLGSNKMSSGISGVDALDGLAFVNTTPSSAVTLSNPISVTSSSVHSSVEEPENKSEDGRSGICAI